MANAQKQQATSLQQMLQKLSNNKDVVVTTMCFDNQCVIKIKEAYNYYLLMSQTYYLDKRLKEQHDVVNSLSRYFKS